MCPHPLLIALPGLRVSWAIRLNTRRGTRGFLRIWLFLRMGLIATALGLGALVFFVFRIISFLGLVESHLMRDVIGPDMLGGREEWAPDDTKGA